tara:strand:+ start:1035 stop:1202 length:168 start_codon:yes stop_codon:yes gene_type:complete
MPLLSVIVASSKRIEVTGARYSEPGNLNQKDIDKEKNRIEVNHFIDFFSKRRNIK